MNRLMPHVVRRREPRTMADLVTEKQFMDTVIELGERLGWTIWHDRDSRKNDPGFPDLICVHPEHGVLWLELKTNRGRVRKEQEWWMNLLQRARQRAYVVRPDKMDWIESQFRGEA